MKLRGIALLTTVISFMAVTPYTFASHSEARSQAQGKSQRSAVPSAQTPAAAHSPSAKANVVIRKVVYGDLDDGVTLDVTDKVRAMVKNGVLSVVAADSNFGDPYKGKELKLTIIKAELRAPNLNFGGPDGAGDITDTIKQFQDGNRLTAKISGGAQKITVYYKYGDGKTSIKEQADDGSIVIAPPTQLRAEYSFNGRDGCRIVKQGDRLEINDKVGAAGNDLNPFLGRWNARWADIVNDVTVEVEDGRPKVTISDSVISGEKFECGILSYKRTVRESGYEFVDKVVSKPNGLGLEVFRMRDGKTFLGKLTKN